MCRGNIQHLLRRALAGEERDVFLRLQYPEGMPLPGILGDLSALTPEEEERARALATAIGDEKLRESVQKAVRLSLARERRDRPV